MKRTRRPHVAYSSDELSFVEGRKELMIGDLHKAFVEKFGRDDVRACDLHALRKRKGWRTGRTGRFDQNSEPWNYGKRMPFNSNSAATQFKKGNRSGVAIHVYKPIGTERVTEEGYLERKINDRMPLQARWRAVHIINWETANGPLPDGHCLKCLDGNKLNTDAANWKLISRSMLPRLAGRHSLAFDTAPAELKPTIMAVAELEHAARKKAKAGA